MAQKMSTTQQLCGRRLEEIVATVDNPQPPTAKVNERSTGRRWTASAAPGIREEEKPNKEKEWAAYLGRMGNCRAKMSASVAAAAGHKSPPPCHFPSSRSESQIRRLSPSPWTAGIITIFFLLPTLGFLT
jgi:hypothetical protein